MAIEPKLGRPDWERFGIEPPGRLAPVGDATRWGGSVTTPIDAAAEGNTPRAIYGQQILLAQTRDPYARSWSLTGTLALPAQQWAEPGVPVLGPFPMDGARLIVALDIVAGLGQVQVHQQILLMSGGDPTNIGLCNTQCSTNGGPYVPTFSDTPPTETSLQARAFAAIGALVGQTISIRGLFVRGGLPGNQGICNFVTLSLVLTPYNAGEGL